ncbi:hypothetical protein [Modestobacter sp. SYSU DS0875]
MSTATLMARPTAASADARPDYYAVAPEAERESAVEALFAALIAQKSSNAAAGYGLVREVVTRYRAIDLLSGSDASAMLSVGEARIPEYLDDDSDLLVDDDD